jgi:hypothetical protein
VAALAVSIMRTLVVLRRHPRGDSLNTTLLINDVESIPEWDMSAGGCLNATAGLIRKDGSSKPAYDEL